MLFDSLTFFIFLPSVFFIYWFLLKNKRTFQNILLLIASYVFYAWWDWRFLSLIFISSLVDYCVGRYLEKNTLIQKRKYALYISIVFNLGLLGIFKYFNFFADNLYDLLIELGMHTNKVSLSVILPVGISFYTFQTMSYTIDVYRNKLKATKDIISFFTYVSFFPQLVAGPIERATQLLPQFAKTRSFNYKQVVDGGRQILWGLFTKIVIADNCAPLVNKIFAMHPADTPGVVLFLGAVLFSFQIYGDFAGYSNIAIGTAKLFGFELMQNFKTPYFSRDIAEFWRRWHISLSTWFRDYLYIPLGGSKVSKFLQIRNVFIIFLISGFWHGANWTFIIWGVIHALFFLPLLLMGKNRKNIHDIGTEKLFPSLQELISMSLTFILVTLAWVFFRAENVNFAFLYIRMTLGNMPIRFSSILNWIATDTIYLWILILLVFEWIQRKKTHGLAIENYPILLRWILYFLIILFIILFGNYGNEQAFIYFQF